MGARTLGGAPYSTNGAKTQGEDTLKNSVGAPTPNRLRDPDQIERIRRISVVRRVSIETQRAKPKNLKTTQKQELNPKNSNAESNKKVFIHF